MWKKVRNGVGVGGRTIGRRQDKLKAQRQMVEMNPNIPKIAINIDGLNSTIKGHILYN